MSVFGPIQVEEVMIGNAVATETTLATFISSASDQELKILSKDGTDAASGVPFRVYQKTAGSAAKNLDYEFSDIIKPEKVEKVVLATYEAETQKSVTVTVDTATASCTYVLEVRLYNDGGTLSPENFAIISGYYTTAASGDTVTTIRDGLITSINYNLTKRGGGELSVTANSTDEIIVAGQAQVAVPGKIIGKQIEFDVTLKSIVVGDITNTNTNAMSSVTTAENDPGNGTGKYAVNLEWFAKGYKYDAARYGGWPADFQDRTPFYASASGVYNVIHILYFEDRQSPTVEKQKKVCTILIDKVSDTLANNASTNGVLDDLQTILTGYVDVPADLPLV